MNPVTSYPSSVQRHQIINRINHNPNNRQNPPELLQLERNNYEFTSTPVGTYDRDVRLSGVIPLPYYGNHIDIRGINNQVPSQSPCNLGYDQIRHSLTKVLSLLARQEEQLRRSWQVICAFNEDADQTSNCCNFLAWLFYT